ncbi:maleylpyruvate isomerase family mycothiol-dependent enzyme [Streptomyces sp. NPDC005438]|uniref:maleylpyruvate isomerase family mycothiol-dependent enzyme n=1 Tax=Streptomyces sp. NPDC005438 TaxID=3156880 RepID=UPI0033B811FD
MDTTCFIEVVRREGGGLLSAAERAGLEAPVPTCPGWTVRELVHHQGNVHRWATGFVRQGYGGPLPIPGETVPDGELYDWFEAGHRGLVEALSEAGEELDCWTFLRGSPSPRHFWARRQAHETTVHRVDAELAGRVTLGEVDRAVAVDGIEELLCGFHGRGRSRVRSTVPRSLRVRPVDSPRSSWTLRLSPEVPAVVTGDPVGPADCELSGEASALYLALWNRVPVEQAARIEGDASLVDLWRANSAIV